jgi:hypothetical protein
MRLTGGDCLDNVGHWKTQLLLERWRDDGADAENEMEVVGAGDENGDGEGTGGEEVGVGGGILFDSE